MTLIPQYSSPEEFRKAFNRAQVFSPELTALVREILQEIRETGNAAVRKFTEKFDGVSRENLNVSPEEWDSAANDPRMLQLLDKAAGNIRRFHREEFKREQSWRLGFTGGFVGQQVTPLKRVGVYVPGGRAAYPSSVLMNVIPAQVAGVDEIVLVSPPSKERGMINPLVLAAAKLLGITEVYAIGGAQAIGALAYGTGSIQAVDKITGPGNQYVNEAKRQIFGQCGIDSLAGPSEILVLADQDADPAAIASGLLSQAEHDPQARAILVTPSSEIMQHTLAELKSQLTQLSRESIARESLGSQGALVRVPSLESAVDLVNQIAPEHLELQVADPEKMLPDIRNAGAIFLGKYTPEPVGDYWAGTNHILPTAGAARYASALSVRDFLRWSSVLQYNAAKLRSEKESIQQFARLEGLDAHAQSVEIRLKEEQKG